MEKNLNIGLALGGGAALGAAHIGVIRAFEEYDIHPQHMSGTSVGALIASFYCFGFSSYEMQTIARELNWFDLSGVCFSQFGIVSNSGIKKMLHEYIGDATFADSPLPLSIVTADIVKGEKVVLSEGSIAEAVMASTSIPGIFVPVERGEQLLVDGGVVENVPIDAITQSGATFRIGVDLHKQHQMSKPNNLLQVLVNTASIALQNTTALQTHMAELMIYPDLRPFNLYDTRQCDELIEAGYQHAKSALKPLLS